VGVDQILVLLRVGAPVEELESGRGQVVDELQVSANERGLEGGLLQANAALARPVRHLGVDGTLWERSSVAQSGCHRDALGFQVRLRPNEVQDGRRDVDHRDGAVDLTRLEGTR
jgi:hypothetical protein